MLIAAKSASKEKTQVWILEKFNFFELNLVCSKRGISDCVWILCNKKFLPQLLLRFLAMFPIKIILSN